MALEPRQHVHRKDLHPFIDLDNALVQQEHYAADPNITVVDTRLDVAAAMTPAMVGDLVPLITPLHYTPGAGTDAGTWAVADYTGAGDSIDGFSFGEDGYSTLESGLMQLSATGERMGLVLKEGRIPADQVFVAPGQTEEQLFAALRMVSKRFTILNLRGTI